MDEGDQGGPPHHEGGVAQARSDLRQQGVHQGGVPVVRRKSQLNMILQIAQLVLHWTQELCLLEVTDYDLAQVIAKKKFGKIV